MNERDRGVLAALAGREAREIGIGMSGARVRRLAGGDGAALYLKTQPVGAGGPGFSLGDEAERLWWMAARGLPVPAVHAYEVADGEERLLLAEMPGVDAATIDARGREGEVVAALAEGLRLLHGTPIAGCPFHHPAASRIAEARARVAAGLVREDELDDERRGRSAADLLVELESLRPPVEDAVFTHGDYCLPNVILGAAPGSSALVLAGFVDCGRAGVADRHQDLALAARSVASNLGAAWVPVLFERYGLARPDVSKLEFHVLLDEFF